MPNNHPNLRILSGRYRGRILQSPTSSTTHPMGSREKLALFNMVNVDQATVLDAYAGSGALGIEALSRNATSVVMVDKDAQALRTIKTNLASLGATATVIKTTLAKFADDPSYQSYFDVIFADPPYDHIDLSELVKLPSLLKPDGILALSTPKTSAELDFPGLRLSSSHTYAGARITIYRKVNA